MMAGSSCVMFEQGCRLNTIKMVCRLGDHETSVELIDFDYIFMIDCVFNEFLNEKL